MHPEGWPEPEQLPQPYHYGNPGPSAPFPNGYPYPGPSYAMDPSAPYGRDPATGRPLSDKTLAAAGCLQLFLGMFGAGRFYIGSTTIGGIQLGLTIFGFVSSIILVGVFVLLGMMVWSWVDAIMMFTGSVTDGQGRKLR
jgi:TM2 domain-containing membrane protein YozV